MKISILSYDELPKEIDRNGLSDNGCGKEYASYILMYHNGKLLNIKSDAMETEDTKFYRDLSWIKYWLEEAYNLGLKKGEK
jgi:hypothetical protein